LLLALLLLFTMPQAKQLSNQSSVPTSKFSKPSRLAPRPLPLHLHYPYAFLVSCLIMHTDNITQCYRDNNY
jgi:hypothetical protein